jgi:hypothetical protein
MWGSLLRNTVFRPWKFRRKKSCKQYGLITVEGYGQKAAEEYSRSRRSEHKAANPNIATSAPYSLREYSALYQGTT